MGANHEDHHHPRNGSAGQPLRVGIGGPVGSGKTELVTSLCRSLQQEHSVVVITNDIFTTEDAQILQRAAVIDDERIMPVQTGCCPHTAIRESGGDNLTATFSRALIDVQIFVIDVAGGDKVPRKGGPGITSSDLLVINKTDLAELVGADLGVMERDARAARGDRPTMFTSLKQDPMATDVAGWVVQSLAAHRSR